MLKKSGIFLVLLFVSILTEAQAPRGIPTGKAEPLEWNLPNIIFFIVLPILIILLYIIHKRNKRK